jgi:diaminohydroxyphosphoribosylaminopyrimidine deaminase/5-amino-6-(5-phosphoribosylamino)uracil reductase
MFDKLYMQKALDLAAKGSGKTSPNPMVGAVLVKGDTIIASDYHRKAGSAHAEVLVLKKAGRKAREATLYVNLEPCCHIEKKTPPCTTRIIQSGIKRLVVAMTDPNPKVSGKGLKEIRKAGIKTKTGVMKKEAEKLNEVFTRFIKGKSPFVILKIAQSLDGKIATAAGESKWITSAKAREHVHRLRNEVDALLVGIGTVKADDPSLDCRKKNGKNPYRVIVDSSLEISLNAKVLKHRDRKTIIATTKKAPKNKITALEKRGIKVLIIKDQASKVNLKILMKELGRLNVLSVMIEGGSSIAASALSGKIVDKVLFFVAPKIIGGKDAIPSVGGKSPNSLNKAIKLINFESIKLGKDILIEGYPQKQ